MAVVLLVGAGLLVHSFLRLNRVDLGIDPQQKLAVEFEFPREEFSEYQGDQEQWRLRERLMDRLQAVPGVDWVE